MDTTQMNTTQMDTTQESIDRRTREAIKVCLASANPANALFVLYRIADKWNNKEGLAFRQIIDHEKIAQEVGYALKRANDKNILDNVKSVLYSKNLDGSVNRENDDN